MELMLKSRQWFVAGALFVLVLAAVVGSILTRDTAVPEIVKGPHAHLAPLVNEQPLITARTLAKLSSNWDEQRFANQALRAADHAVDLAFEDALRDATNHPTPPTAETQEIYSRLGKSQAALKLHQEQLADLKKRLGTASAAHQDEIQQQIDLIQAQIELDQDEVDDAKGDLIRSGADKVSRVQRQFNRHEATEHANDATPQNSPTATPINYQSGNLWGQLTAWKALRDKRLQLEAARDEAAQAAQTLSESHNVLDKQIATEKSAHAVGQQNAQPSGQPAASSDAIASLKRLSDDQKTLSDLDKRVQDQQELETVYSNWMALVESHQRTALHGMIGESALWILLIILLVYLADRAIDQYLADVGTERTRLHTLRVVIRFTIQAIGALLILLVVFGAPQQTPTILGFAGAGLTVALKDFIVAFVGWFVLMGKNGIRVGDWVEINGVAGEVIEINLLRTVLLETGNWTDTGHPTGRKVAFVNSYAIEGHFFNFTTSGQWLWDEIQITVPANRDPHLLIDQIQKVVNQETSTEAKAAEEEWGRITTRYRVRAVSATPAVTLRPTGTGVELHVRYIARAHDRFAMRARLNQALVQVLRQGADAKEGVSAGK